MGTSYLNTRAIIASTAFRLGFAKYLFIHIPKNAGTSIHKNKALRGRLFRPDLWCLKDNQYRTELQAAFGPTAGHGAGHARWRDIRPDVQTALTAVAISRNPWARVASRYFYLLKHYEHFPNNYDQSNKPSFEAFLDERHEKGELPYYWHRAVAGWYNQLDYVVDEAGKQRVDILRLEHLGAEAAQYFGFDPGIEKRNTSAPVKQTASWQSLYTDQTIQIVADWYKRDIDHFGFEFDGAARRNYWAADHSDGTT